MPCSTLCSSVSLVLPALLALQQTPSADPCAVPSAVGTVAGAPAPIPDDLASVTVPAPVGGVTQTSLVRVDDSNPSGRALSIDEEGRSVLLGDVRRAVVTGFPLTPTRTADLSMERFDVLAPDVQVVVGERNRPLDFDRDRVALYRGWVIGEPTSTVVLAVSDLGVLGSIELGPGQPRYALGPADPSVRGLADGPLALVESTGFGAPPLVDMCVCVEPDSPHDAGGVAGSATPLTRLIELAVDTDHEFFTLFDSAEDAAAYVTALYGVISDLYLRSFDARVMITYVRLWDDPDDLFNEPDPLGPFVGHWESKQGEVPRDVAQLLTGRRNLPYGGVAYLGAVCGSLGYSVNGYLNGSFASPDSPDPGNWDVVVTAHELGHNCGTGHTHDYGLDGCAFGEVRRAGIMSYCHVVSGGVSNIDLRFETFIQGIVGDFLSFAPCVGTDCDGNGIDDLVDIQEGRLDDVNGDGVPDTCQDCNENGILDPVEIAEGTSADLNANGRPDECEPDCNQNGVPDSVDIAFGSATDLYLDGIPDLCEIDCDDDGLSDYSQIQADMSLDVDRNGALDACQDCDADGVNDFDQLGDGLSLWVGSTSAAPMRLFHPRTGVPVRTADAGSGILGDVLLTPDGRLLASHITLDAVAEYDPVTGEMLGLLVTSEGGLDAPLGLLVDGRGRLLVASSGTSEIRAYDLRTGVFEEVVVAGEEVGMVNPFAMTLTPSGSLLVSAGQGGVREFSADTGALLRVAVPEGSGGLVAPRGLLVLPDGRLLVVSGGSDAILSYDYASGAFLGRFDVGGVTNGYWGLRGPWEIQLDATGGRVFVSANLGSAAIHAYDVSTGQFQRSFYVIDDDIPLPSGFAMLPPGADDCNANALVDACEIAAGMAADANANGVPDECEGGPGGSPDLNGDGSVDGADVGLLLAAWGPCSRPSGCAADLTGDGGVDGADLGVLLASWTG